MAVVRLSDAFHGWLYLPMAERTIRYPRHDRLRPFLRVMLSGLLFALALAPWLVMLEGWG